MRNRLTLIVMTALLSVIVSATGVFALMRIGEALIDSIDDHRIYEHGIGGGGETEPDYITQEEPTPLTPL